MTDADVAMADDVPAVLFRPSKKRKVYRQRLDADTENFSSLPPSAAPPATLAEPTAQARVLEAVRAQGTNNHDSNDDEDEGGEGGVVKARNTRRLRPLGVAFKTNTAAAATAPAESVQMLDADEADTDLALYDPSAPVPNRFTAATGLTTELNTRHMMEYIESGLAKRFNRQQPAPTPSAAATAPANPSRPGSIPASITEPPSAAAAAAATTTAGQPAALRGRILEVDLGDEVRSRNAELTARAASRLKGAAEAGLSDDGSIDPSDRRRRRGGPNQRRDDDAIERDRLVEEFLHENRLDVYDLHPTTGVVQSSGGNYFENAELDIFNNVPDDAGIDPSDPHAGTSGAGAVAADDRIAEQFRREFMEALHERQQLRRRKRKAASNAPPPPRHANGPPPPSGGGPTRPGKKDDGEILRGPKLGGSRNDRAQMRDLLLANQKEKKGSGLAGMPRRR